MAYFIYTLYNALVTVFQVALPVAVPGTFCLMSGAVFAASEIDERDPSLKVDEVLMSLYQPDLSVNIRSGNFKINVRLNLCFSSLSTPPLIQK